VGDGCGIKVRPDAHAAARDGLATGLLDLAEKPALRTDLAAKALAHVEANYTWDHVAATIDKAYAGILSDKNAAQT